MRGKDNRKLNTWIVILLVLLPIVTAAAALCIGRILLSPREVFLAVLGRIRGISMVSGTVELTVMNIRLPRILLALLAGAGLSCAGCAFQSLFANPLATPDTLGVAGGASFGAALGILMGFGLLGIQAVSFAFGILAVVLTWLGGSGRGRGLSSVVLSGIMIGSLFSALVSLVKFIADDEAQLPAITYWLMGSLQTAGYKSLIYGAPPIIAGVVILLLLRWRLNLLPLSEDEARSSGANIKALRAVTVVCATAMTASCVSMCGQVGWVGLLIPHMCRMLYGSNHVRLMPSAVSFGAAFLVIVDTVARSATAAEIPISILTAIIGAPFFIILMRRSGGWSL